MKRMALTLTTLLFMPAMAFAQRVAAKPYPLQGQTANDVGEVLIVILVLSVIFEVALTPLFNWRFFLARFEGKGYKTPITIAFALLVLWSYDIDIIADLLNALDHTAKASFWGQVITALLVAGGSDGVLRVFDKLKIRDLKARDDKAKVAQEQYKAAQAAAKKS